MSHHRLEESLESFAQELEKIAEIEKDAGLKEMYQASANKARSVAKNVNDAILRASVKLHSKIEGNKRLAPILQSALDPNGPDTSPVANSAIEVGKRIIGH